MHLKPFKNIRNRENNAYLFITLRQTQYLFTKKKENPHKCEEADFTGEKTQWQTVSLILHTDNI